MSLSSASRKTLQQLFTAYLAVPSLSYAHENLARNLLASNSAKTVLETVSEIAREERIPNRQAQGFRDALQKIANEADAMTPQSRTEGTWTHSGNKSSSGTEVVLLPNKDAERKICETLSAARRSVKIICKRLSQRKIIETLARISSDRVDVCVLVEAERGTRGLSSQLSILQNAGVRVHVSGLAAGELQTKFCVIDGVLSMTGAFNWGEKEFKTLFDTMIFTRDSGVTSKLSQEFDYHWQNSETLADDDIDLDNVSRLSEPRSTNNENRDRSRSRERPTAGGQKLFGIIDESYLDVNAIKNSVKSLTDPITKLMDKAEQIQQFDQNFKNITGQGILPDNISQGFAKAKKIKDDLGF